MSRGNSRSHNSTWIAYCRLSRTNITGYKKKKLGHPSEKLSSDVPRAGWRAVLFSEIIIPIVMAILFTIAYMFVKSFPINGKENPSPLIRIAVIALGPLVLNAGILLALFFMSIMMGPILSPRYPLFGSIMAAVAHIFGTIGMIAFFEFLVSALYVSTKYLSLTLFAVGIGTLECITCSSGSGRCDCDPACHP
jgi:1,3-beta-glucan synthase